MNLWKIEYLDANTSSGVFKNNFKRVMGKWEVWNWRTIGKKRSGEESWRDAASWLNLEWRSTVWQWSSLRKMKEIEIRERLWLLAWDGGKKGWMPTGEELNEDIYCPWWAVHNTPEPDLRWPSNDFRWWHLPFKAPDGFCPYFKLWVRDKERKTKKFKCVQLALHLSSLGLCAGFQVFWHLPHVSYINHLRNNFLSAGLGSPWSSLCKTGDVPFERAVWTPSLDWCHCDPLQMTRWLVC